MPIFNSPPGWPVPPPGWKPPNDWKPDPSWPAAPPGWQWWIEEWQLEAEFLSLRQRLAECDERQLEAAAEFASLQRRLAESDGRQLDAAAENVELRQRLDDLEPAPQLPLTDLQRAELEDIQRQVADANEKLARVRASLVRTEELALLQEAGIYEYLHPLDNAPAYKLRLDILRSEIKAMVNDGKAVHATSDWSVNGSATEGRRMVRDFSRLMLRAYNAEADTCVQTVRQHRLDAAIDRLNKVREAISKLGKTMSIRIADPYHFVRIQEIKLTADYRGKVEEEKELARGERERLREEARAQREFEREKAKLIKEQSHYESALAKLQENGEDTSDMEAKLAELDEEIGSVVAREANIRAGYVYVISNIGAFGPDVVKIGMTRRLEPEDRIRELGDASVPFKFDTHALIFSDDAVGLEGKLHNALEAKRVNQVNLRREFFYATPAEVRVLLEDFAGQHLLEYHETAEALEWRASNRE